MTPEIRELKERIADLEQSRDEIADWNDTLRKSASVNQNKIDELTRENALLRKALAGAPHTSMCSSWDYVNDDSLVRRPCDCWKAALARIPEAPK
jgi:hypothetical protein